MLKKLLLALAAFIATMGFAFAQVDVNKADQAALDGVKGIGPSISKKIIDERKKGGDFKDWADFESRVKGVGEKNSVKLSQAGLVVNGQSKANAPAATKPAKEPKAKESTAKAAPAPSTAPVAASTPSAPAAANAKEDKKESKADKKKNKKAEKAEKAEKDKAAANAAPSAADKK